MKEDAHGPHRRTVARHENARHPGEKDARDGRREGESETVENRREAVGERSKRIGLERPGAIIRPGLDEGRKHDGADRSKHARHDEPGKSSEESVASEVRFNSQRLRRAAFLFAS